MRIDLSESRNGGGTLVMGFYGRGNLGDDAFSEIAKELFPGAIVASMDDVKALPPGTRSVVVLGGDVVNPYFMDRLSRLVRGFRGPVVGLGVGVPYENDSTAYLPAFDRVVLRSPLDVPLASACMPPGSYSTTPDLATLLPRPPRVVGGPRIAVMSVAGPMAPGGDPQSDLVEAGMAAVASGLAETHDVLYVAAFNTGRSAKESDVALCERVAAAASSRGDVRTFESPEDPSAMLSLMASAELAVCSRFHAAVFAMHAGTPRIIAPHCARKIRNLLESRGALESCGVSLPTDSRFRPTSYSPEDVLAACADPDRGSWSGPMEIADPEVLREALEGAASEAEAVESHRCPATSAVWRRSRTAREALLYASELAAGSRSAVRRSLVSKGFVDARMVAYAASGGHVASPCLWGLEQVSARNDRVPDPSGSAAYVWNHHSSTGGGTGASRWVPARRGPGPVSMSFADRRSDPGAGVHRSGWPFVAAAISRVSSAIRDVSPLVVDTYVDRTFHWGATPLEASDVVPYRSRWLGFVHHTFCETHGPWNCARLFREPAFLESLRSCACLVALSEDLASRLRSALDSAGHPGVRVVSMSHPTEPASPEAAFDPGSLVGPAPRVVQVGAWLRDPYAVYDLELMPGSAWVKTHLRGRGMDAAFPPDGLDGMLEGLVEGCLPGVSRLPEASTDASGCPNEFVKGLVGRVRRSIASVEVIGPLDDSEYDALLSGCVVFLNLVDASAVNTVIECVARCTPLLVNRLPAVVEVLGEDYPGFYGNLAEASAMLEDRGALLSMHEHMKGVSSKTSVAAFEAALASVIRDVSPMK